MSDEAPSKADKAPKITIRDAAPATAVRSAAPARNPYDPVEITDSRGRVLKVRKIKAMDRFRIAKLLGAEDSTNLGLLGIAWGAASVTEIDGDPVFFPAKAIELEAQIQRIDDEGLEAVNRVYTEQGWNQGEVDRDAVKN